MDTERVNREVIEGKLLASLEEGGKVAVVCSARDLRTLIYGLTAIAGKDDRPAALREDLIRLHSEAFGE